MEEKYNIIYYFHIQHINNCMPWSVEGKKLIGIRMRQNACVEFCFVLCDCQGDDVTEHHDPSIYLWSKGVSSSHLHIKHLNNIFSFQ